MDATGHPLAINRETLRIPHTDDPKRNDVQGIETGESFDLFRRVGHGASELDQRCPKCKEDCRNPCCVAVDQRRWEEETFGRCSYDIPATVTYEAARSFLERAVDVGPFTAHSQEDLLFSCATGAIRTRILMTYPGTVNDCR